MLDDREIYVYKVGGNVYIDFCGCYDKVEFFWAEPNFNNDERNGIWRIETLLLIVVGF